MARGKKRSKAESAPEPATEETPHSDGEARRPSEARAWLAEAWAGWLQSVVGIAVLAFLYVGYRTGFLGEWLLGPIAIVVLLAVALGWPLALLLSKRRGVRRAASIAVVVGAFVGAVYPPLRLAIPGAVLATAKLTSNQKTGMVTTPAGQSLVALVSGRLDGAQAEVDYRVEISSAEGTETIDGKLERRTVSRRTGRRGGMSTAVLENNENLHRLPALHGGPLKVTSETADDKLLPSGLIVELYAAPLPAAIFWGLCAAALIAGFILDGKQSERGKRGARSYLCVGIGAALVFSIDMLVDGTPHAIVGVTLSAAILAAVAGALPGYLLSTIARATLGRAPQD